MRLYQPAQFVAMLACSVLASTIVLTSAPTRTRHRAACGRLAEALHG